MVDNNNKINGFPRTGFPVGRNAGAQNKGRISKRSAKTPVRSQSSASTFETKQKKAGLIDPLSSPFATPPAPKTTVQGKAASEGKQSVQPPLSNEIGKAASGHNYRLEISGKEYKLVHNEDPGRAYIISIHPQPTTMDGPRGQEVADCIGKLLKLVDDVGLHQNHGGIQSVTFSGDSGQLTYKNQPGHPVTFGGPNDAEHVSHVAISDLLKQLHALLNADGDSKGQTTVGLRAASSASVPAPGTDDSRDAAKHVAAETQKNADARQAAQNKAQAEAAAGEVHVEAKAVDSDGLSAEAKAEKNAAARAGRKAFMSNRANAERLINATAPAGPSNVNAAQSPEQAHQAFENVYADATGKKLDGSEEGVSETVYAHVNNVTEALGKLGEMAEYAKGAGLEGKYAEAKAALESKLTELRP